MEALLPSEIARLILGYLEEENCQAVAKMFLESSPLLRECHNVVRKGGKFTRKVNGVTLMTLLDKYCAIHALVQERLSKMEGLESLKTSGDILEQLRFLMDGSRGQRFVVNINVPTQNTSQVSSASPIISSSMRKRRHSGPVDRDRSKSISNCSFHGRSETSLHQPCDTVESTSLEQLPGHQNSLKEAGVAPEDDRRVQCSLTSTSTEPPPPSLVPNTSDNPERLSGADDPERQLESVVSNQTCETGTDTKELMFFTNTEVQTAPCKGYDNSVDLVDGPVENLSLLTKELLNRTELQERIAQTINRTLIPAEASFSESTSGECNTSIMRELDHAIKSIVIETETDPVFEQFLLETIGEGLEGEMSPDEDGAPSPVGISEKLAQEAPPGEVIINSVKGAGPVEISAEKSQEKSCFENAPGENTHLFVRNSVSLKSVQIPAEKDLAALDDVNAEAILSIINVNNTSKELDRNKPIPQTQIQGVLSLPVVGGETEVSMKSNNHQLDVKSKRKRVSKPKRERKPLTPEKHVPENELVPVPTLIVCSQEEIDSMKVSVMRPTSQFVPIMPKGGMVAPFDPTLYLRTVNVARPKDAPEAAPGNLQFLRDPEPIVTNPQHSNELQILPKPSGSNESITLYGPESGEAVVQADLPSVQLDESISLTGTGLSPFLKLHKKPASSSSSSSSSSSQSQSMESNPPGAGELNKEGKRLTAQSNSDILTKRTPRSIMKSRSRNHRLSLSTPRRRSSHIRALDFNTPTKAINTSRRMSDADKSCAFSPKSAKGLSKACRTSLFKSPPFENVAPPQMKIKTPSKLCKEKIPIATRSPAPKLIGGWDKISGVGMIIEGSSQSSCPSPEKNTFVNSDSAISQMKRPWDSDLRLKVAADVQPLKVKGRGDLPKKRARSVRRQTNLRKIKDAEERGAIANISDDEAAGISAEAELNEQIAMNETPGDFPNIVKADGIGVENTVKLVDKKYEEMNVEISKKATESLKKICQVVTEQGITKKYAKLKTLTTTVSKVEIKREKPRTPGETLEKSLEFGSIDASTLLDLETPRKFDPNLVPPTPRLLSPSSNMTTPFAQISEGSDKIQTFVSTPEFPPTPSINLTPKQSNDSTMNDTKKDFSSRYYQPSAELKEATKTNKIPDPIKIAEEPGTTKIDFQASTTQLEITQFEVIKGNLPKAQAIKELKLARNESQVQQGVNEISSTNKSSRSLESSGTADESSDSDSDTSSSSSSGSTSSCSCCDTTNTSSKMSTSRKSKKASHKIERNTSTTTATVHTTAPLCTSTTAAVTNFPEECPVEVLADEPMEIQPSAEDSSKENIDSQKMNEKSPLKVIPITKTEENLKGVDLETPAKDETLLAEADISETPSSSKAGIENLTNLNSKISAIIKEDWKPRLCGSQGKPRIISVQNLSPTVKLRKISDEELENATKALTDAKLARELDEKRLRMINKIKSDNNSGRTRSSRSRETIAKNQESVPTTKLKREKAEASAKKTGTQPLRKSLRNAEKRAKRGLSEPTEATTSQKIEEPRKTQSSRDSSANDEGNLQIMILPTINILSGDSPPLDETNPTISYDLEELEMENNNEKDVIAEGKEKCVKVKSKVDLVKRDLFSDEENTDGKPIKSKYKNLLIGKENVEDLEQQAVESGNLPGVLESLELVPTNKSSEGIELDVGTYQHIEISFVYDETQPRKKRRKKISTFDLPEIKAQAYTLSGEFVWKMMTCIPYEEIFTITPTRKRRVRPLKPRALKEKPVTTVTSRRKGRMQLKNSESVVSEIKSKPLATSSPVNSEEKIPERVKAPAKEKSEDKVVKPRKRKQSESNDYCAEKKPRTSNPTALLSGLDINKLLNKVHGSES
uniref:Uncharacterized protein n=1 Tax=Fopius arisanus TaxID=64838 RepID=A0A0C9PIU1_9HYME